MGAPRGEPQPGTPHCHPHPPPSGRPGWVGTGGVFSWDAVLFLANCDRFGLAPKLWGSGPGQRLLQD